MNTTRVLIITLLAASMPAIAGCGATLQSTQPGRRPDLPWSIRMIESFLSRNPDSIAYATEKRPPRWTYEQGVMLEALSRAWKATGERKYFDYIRKNIDSFVRDDGSIESYEYDTFNLDNINTGRQLLTLFAETGNIKYRLAADTLRRQLANQPRTPSGGFWHKKIYPNQMWLDGIYMAEPFYARYGLMFNEPKIFDSVVHQITLIEQRTRDAKSGLLSHAWDESRQQRWANLETGRSPHFWGRAIGWYAMGLVDVLDYLPADHPGRESIIAVLQRLCKALLAFQDSSTGVWYQVVDQGGRSGNYREASVSCMAAYAMAKGANKGYLDPAYRKAAERAFDGILREFVTVDPDGLVHLHQTCSVAGLGGDPYRDGSYEYYINEPRRSNDFKGLGPFIFAALELGR